MFRGKYIKWGEAKYCYDAVHLSRRYNATIYNDLESKILKDPEEC